MVEMGTVLSSRLTNLPTPLELVLITMSDINS